MLVAHSRLSAAFVTGLVAATVKRPAEAGRERTKGVVSNLPGVLFHTGRCRFDQVSNCLWIRDVDRVASRYFDEG
jgi:hypothetical protein